MTLRERSVTTRERRGGRGYAAAMTWLITGGAGYIGAHVVRAMTAAGERVVVGANFLIDAESNLRAALQAFTAPKEGALP